MSTKIKEFIKTIKDKFEGPSWLIHDDANIPLAFAPVRVIYDEEFKDGHVFKVFMDVESDQHSQLSLEIQITGEDNLNDQTIDRLEEEIREQFKFALIHQGRFS